MVAGGPPKPGGGGWIATRPPLDGPSRLRILVGVLAVVVAALSSLALLNLLVLEPVVGEGPGDTGGDSGGGDIGTGGQPGGSDSSGEPGNGTDQPGQRDNPCTTAKSVTGGFAITFTVLSMGLWVLSVWWRQSRQTRVMNGWAITALVFTLISVTLLFAWWLVTKICNLDVFDLQACRDIANSLRGAFFGFLIPGLGLVGYAVVKKRQGGRFFGLWSGAGFVFVYIAVLALVGWLVADDFCDRRFEPPEDLPDPDDPDGGDPGGGDGGDTGGDDSGGDPGSTGGDSGGGSRTGGGGGSGGGSGGGGLPTFSAPQLSPVTLLVLLGMAAAVVILVLALRSRHNQTMAIAGGAPEEVAVEDRQTLLALLKRTDLRSSDRVVAAYRSYLAWATVRGVGKYPHETPREHGERVAYELDLPWEKTEPLLEAYTHVRLGDQDLDEDLRRKAVAFAEGIRDGSIRPGRPYAVPDHPVGKEDS